MAKIENGEAVIVVLQNPREKIWGVLHEISPAGAFVFGVDLNSFEDFVRALQNQEPFYGLSEQFIPLWRLEKITKDEACGEIPSMQQEFEKRTGLLLAQM
jgi:hypothetical protein